MDIKCPKCSEPWDFDSLHEEAQERYLDKYGDLSALHRDLKPPYEPVFDEVRKDFYANGCKALGSRCSDNVAHPAIAELYDLLGSDIDGAAGLLEDFGL